MQSEQTTADLKQRRIYDKLLDMELYSHQQEFRQTHPMLKLQIQLEDGKKVYINPQPCDEPFRLASQICEEHNLDTEMIDILAESIKKSIDYSHQSCRKQTHLPSAHSQPVYNKKANLQCKHHAGQQFKLPNFLGRNSESLISLYHKGMMRSDAKKHWIAREKQRKINEELRECTHKPSINKLSRSLVSERDISLPRNEKQSVQAHTPVLSSKDVYSMRSSIIVDLKSPPNQSQHEERLLRSGSDVFLKLYENRRHDEITRSKILSQIMKQQTHKPHINNISKQIVGKVNFKQRLARYEKEKQERQHKLKKSELIEKENLYKPKVGIAPKNRNVEKLPIGDFLYRKKKKPQVVKCSKPQPVINNHSKQIYENKKMLAFKNIFDYLDINNEGKVEWKCLQKVELKEEYAVILSPLLEEIQIMQIQLNQEDFKTALNFLFNTLTPQEKTKILRFCEEEKKIGVQINQFKSEINKNSDDLARKIGREHFSIYDYCLIKQTQKLLKIESQRIAKERRQMRECTFEPKLQRKSLYY